MKKFGIVIAVIISVVVIGLLTGYSLLNKQMDGLLEMEINELDLSQISDGEYLGEFYYSNIVGAKVKVSILNQKIVSIDLLEHLTGLGEKAETIIDVIIEDQSLLVDDVAGATSSSRVIKLALKNALEE